MIRPRLRSVEAQVDKGRVVERLAMTDQGAQIGARPFLELF